MSRLSKEWKSREKPCYFRLLMKRHCVIEKGRVILSLNLVKPKCLSLNNQWLQSVILFPLNIQMMWAAVSQTSPSAWNWPHPQRFHQLLHSQGCCLENVWDEAGGLPFRLSAKPAHAASAVNGPCEVDAQRCFHHLFDLVLGGRGPLCTLSYSIQSKNQFLS